MPDGPKIIDAETLATKLGPARMGELLARAKKLQAEGRGADEIARVLREEYHELDDWLPKAVWHFIGR